MVAGLCTFPPLGRVSQVKSQVISFSVILEAADHDAEQPWEMSLWHSSGDQPWEETTLSLALESDSPSFLRLLDGSSHERFCYTAELPLVSTLHFTVKYRSSPTKPWIWARDELGVDNGLVILNQEDQHTLASDLSHIIQDLNPELKVRSVASQTPRTQLWTVEAVVGPSRHDVSAYADVELGTPWGSFERYFALVRHSSAWLGPRQGKTHFSLDKDALLCSFLSREGKHLVLLGISNINSVITLLRSSDCGTVTIHIRNDENASSTGMVLAAVGDNCESAIAAAVYHARILILSCTQNTLPQELADQSDDINPEWVQDWCDGLGYCTWNALGQQLTEDKLLNAVRCLKENNIHISNLIIDDNWQDVDYHGLDSNSYGWKRFEAEPTAFPNGLKHTVSQIRKISPGIEKIAVWHALLGYWGGISPSGDIAKEYQTVKIPRDGWKVSGPMTVIANADVARFYNDFYQFLVSCGVDGVKTDAQFMIDTWSSADRRRELTNTYLDSWGIAALRHFGDRAISCMSQAPQILLRQQLSQIRPTIPVRNSDDYFPDVPDSHPWHIWANAHNALFTQHLNVFPDWDMFQTAHETAHYHAAARCVSGGPIYITDAPGHHDLGLINQITSLTPRGKTVILRPSVVGKTIDAYTGYDEDALLKVGCYNGRSAIGTPILALFNTTPHTVTEIIPFDSFPGVTTSTEYVVRSHYNGKVAIVRDSESRQAHLGITLQRRGYDIFTAYPLTHLDTDSNGRISTASLGLIDKMTGAAALIVSHFEFLPTGMVFCTTRLKALGILGLYISDLPHMSIKSDFMITIQGLPIPFHTVTVDERDDHVLTVDIQTAWSEMGLNSGWSNEVEVRINFDAEHV
ncbi:raffinose synthase Sip1 [Xylaria bambusicola]|uniref:raffinose synthase Sip1 n=1 Tax=Xylaria bambusicola TaxID=326684 RepID=UPI0020081C0F|nr:raffinose synthase Sip1 [Xylaria bambusicola]KAI0517125.1 raffinose synthase Sip1 [Xylaria bambusicola]